MSARSSPPDTAGSRAPLASRTNQIRLVFAVFAVVFFATPLVLIAVGVRARAFENRRLAPTPKLADGWSVFDDTTRYLIDRLPLRDKAVHANTWIDRHVFAVTPQYGVNGLGGVANDQALPFTGRPQQDQAAVTATTPSRAAPAPQAPAPYQVIPGSNGWYFLLGPQGVFDRACKPFIPLGVALSRWEQLLSVIRASGRRAVLIVAPDKSTIYPEYLTPQTPNRACGLAGTAALWRLIESPQARAAGIIGLRKPLLALKAATHASIYYKTDSHWNNIGSLTMGERLLPALGSTVRVKPSEIVDTGPRKYSGDLLVLLGQSGSEIAPTRAIRRAPGAPVVPGKTVLWGDSYAEDTFGQLKPYFASITMLPYTLDAWHQLPQTIIGAKTVVIETVEREFDYRATDPAYITPGFIAEVQSALASHPVKP
jgi:alginate O-acetyltransferase complex protein AlgJ